MLRNPPQRSKGWSRQHSISLALLLLATGALASFALLMPFSARPSAQPLALGDVASQDILAPRSESYTSEVLSERERQSAADAVEPIFAAPSASIARAQVEQLRAVANFINSVRADQLATREFQLADLAALQDITLGQESAEAILDLNEAGWQSVQQEAVAVLEQLMRSAIREDRLEEARRTIPALVSLAVPEEQAELVVELVSAFVAANSLFSEELTEAAREAARQSVEPVRRTFLENETIVQRGQVVSEEDLEALEAFGLLQPAQRVQDQLAVLALVLASLAFAVLYLRTRPDLSSDVRSLSIIAVLFLIFLYGARFAIPNRTVIPYVYPMGGFSLVIASLFSVQAGILFTIPLGIMAAYGLPNALDLTIFYVVSGVFGVLALRRGERILSFFGAGAAITAVGAAIIVAYRLPEPTTDLIGIATLVGAALLSGLGAASITLILQYLLAQVLGLTTTLQLMEISRPDHPLLQFVLRNAPGTYQHSLQIANLAEQAAELIGANALLTRVGALYHDVGKVRQPHYFIENQVPGSRNPHEDLSPEESAGIIIRHVPDGLELATKYRLPKRIHDFIAEHHGTLVTRYQYARAVEAAGGDSEKVKQRAYRYPGPRPQSVETALVMLADGCEARARAERPDTKEELRDLVKTTIDYRVGEGQLNDTEITMRDLETIVESFTTTLRGIYHPRIQYPSLEEKTQPSSQVETPIPGEVKASSRT